MSSSLKKRKIQSSSGGTARKTKPKANGSLSAAESKKENGLDDDFLFEADTDEEALDEKKGGESETGGDLQDYETPDERRLRLAKAILAKVGADQEEDGEEEEEEEAKHYGGSQTEKGRDGVPSDPIDRRLRQDAMKEQGKLQRHVASKLSSKKLDNVSIRLLRGHRLSVTCAALTQDDGTAYSGSKDGSIIRWDIETGAKVFTIDGARGAKGKDGHTDELLGMAVSTDGLFLATGGRDKMVRLWDTRSNGLIRSFPGHRDAVTCLAFRANTHEFFTGSADRTVKVWNADTLAYVETLFGHQSEVTGIASLFQNRAVTSGSDRSVRVWKVVEETQLLFKGCEASIDCIAMLTEDQFFTGAQDGSIALWSSRKKKPLHITPAAHAGEWVSAVGALTFGDVVASGSSDGFLKLWRCDHGNDLQLLHSFSVTGFVNAIAFAQSGRFVLAGVGQEHRLGRWSRFPKARNGLHLVPLITPDEGNPYVRTKASYSVRQRLEEEAEFEQSMEDK